MQSSTGQWSSHKGEPAQLEQFSSITARRAVPLRFFVDSTAMRLSPCLFILRLQEQRRRDQKQRPIITNELEFPPFQPINEIGGFTHKAAQSLLGPGIIPRVFSNQHPRRYKHHPPPPPHFYFF